MNRKEYMERLQMDLEAVDETTAKEILQDFADHFDQGLSEGRSEEEISAELGDPAELISELNTRPHHQSQTEAQPDASTLSAVVIEADSADITLRQGNGYLSGRRYLSYSCASLAEQLAAGRGGRASAAGRHAAGCVPGH